MDLELLCEAQMAVEVFPPASQTNASGACFLRKLVLLGAGKLILTRNTVGLILTKMKEKSQFFIGFLKELSLSSPD
ncbi:hypothetical protein [Paenibacillus sp. J2TS4]|uniref:hypothetical protein n=1 Tax=Paenibacillus sp. J2TS4 TaxID=2807194 RepID=UPI001B234757|nr:hypothetical protein [Paenibacillus sp. J2TS4]GIP32895.1 hypothetical protein J2TS4_21050 [Paenibacillus sp. J2TS4]